MIIPATKNIPPNTPTRMSPVLLSSSFVVDSSTHKVAIYICIYRIAIIQYTRTYSMYIKYI